MLPVVISGRASLAVEARACTTSELECHLDVKDKVAVAEQVLAREGARWDECVMLGDDLPDVPLMRRVGWAIAVADAQPEVLALAQHGDAARRRARRRARGGGDDPAAQRRLGQRAAPLRGGRMTP